LKLLPEVDHLRALLQSFAMLDAILCPDWQFRYYSFNSHWSKRKLMGSMRNGSGDEYFALFNIDGCFMKGFAHEATMSPYRQSPKRVWQGVLEGIPSEFAACVKEPAFNLEDTTFCIWRRYSDESWQCGAIKFPAGPDPDGSASLLSIFDGQPTSYGAWAKDYYERPVRLTAIREIYAHKPLTEALIKQLNAEMSLEKLAPDIKEIGYPRR
jgi:hypothetical protein